MNIQEFDRAINEESSEAMKPVETFVASAAKYPWEFLKNIFDQKDQLDLRAPDSQWEIAQYILLAAWGAVKYAALMTVHEAAEANDFTEARVKAFRAQADQIVAGYLAEIRVYDESIRILGTV